MTAPVSSPSFVIETQYRGRLTLYHVDLYRLERIEPALLGDLEEHLFGDGIAAVEWAERLPPELREGAVIRFSGDGDAERTVTLLSAEERLVAAAARVTLLLALDTSTRIASVALHDGEQVLSETTWLAGREHSSRLLVEVEAALERIGRTPSDLTGLVVAHGPGSFTGRAGGDQRGQGHGRGFVAPAVGRLDAGRRRRRRRARSTAPVRVVVEAGRARWRRRCYRHGRCVEAARLATLRAARRSAEEPTLVIGELTPRRARRWPNART